jgi:hypothetical protein
MNRASALAHHDFTRGGHDLMQSFKEASMPKAWSAKDERQYEHIKKSSASRGRSSKRAKEIAAATVNKKRRQEGRTKKAGKKTKR